MESQVTIYPDGQVAEFQEGQLLRLMSTGGDISTLIQGLRFSRATQFTISAEAAPSHEAIAQSRGRQPINDNGLKLLTRFEGCKLNAYDDGVGVWTIGYGHTAGVVPGLTITQAKAEEFLQQDLEIFESYVADLVDVELNRDQFSALVCFCYNVGPGPDGFGGSTLLRLLNSGDFDGATQQFLRWNKGGGQPMLGLTRRRLAEQALFKSQSWEFALSYDGSLDIPAEPSKTASKVARRLLQLTEPRMEGDDIRQLQLGLQNAGFAVTPDGIFGPATAAAIRQWQQREGWTVDGIVGPSLFTALV